MLYGLTGSGLQIKRMKEFKVTADAQKSGQNTCTFTVGGFSVKYDFPVFKY